MMNPMMMMMNPMMMMQWSGMGMAGGGSTGDPKCKWCKKGECWTHMSMPMPMMGAAIPMMGASTARSAPYTNGSTTEKIAEPATEDEVSLFLSAYPVDLKASTLLKSVSPQVQTLIINRHLEGDDLSKALIARIIE